MARGKRSEVEPDPAKPAAQGGPDEDEPEETLVRLLRDLGIPAKAAAKVLDTGRTLRERTRETGDEYAAMVNERTGNRLGKILRGNPERTDITPHLQEMRTRLPRHRFVQVHSHPRAASRSFSADDALVIAGEEQISAMVVAGADGRWFVLARLPQTPVPETESEERLRMSEVFEKFRQTYNRFRLAYDRRVDAGELSEDEARSAHTHEVWERIADGLGMRYFRCG